MSQNTLDNVEKMKTLVVDVERVGDKILIPEGMSYVDAMEVLRQRAKYEEEEVNVVEQFNDAFCWDAANAFAEAMKEMFGWYGGKTLYSFFGTDVPQLVNVAISETETVQVPIGNFTLPNVKGIVNTGFSMDSTKRVIFTIQANVLRKHENQIKELCQLARKNLTRGSIYRGKAIMLRFRDDDGNILKMPEPKFMSLKGVNENDLILNKNIEEAVQTNVFVPIERREDCKALGIPTKRGVLLGGKYGVGKTMISNLAAKKAIDNGVTFVYCQRAEDFHDCARFAIKYGPAVLFCEDIDRVMSGERDMDMDSILNIMDGVDSKGAEVLFVLTTNDLEGINQAMLRPGRLDVVIEIPAPDGESAIRLARLYGRGLIREEEDLSGFGVAAAGNIPAVIREIVERSKLSALRLLPNGSKDFHIPSGALTDSARTMKRQLALLNKENPQEPNAFEVLGNSLGIHLRKAVMDAKRSGVDLRKINAGGVTESVDDAVAEAV